MRKPVLLRMAALVAALAGGSLLAGPASTASSGAATVQLSRAYETVQAAAATIDARYNVFGWSCLRYLTAGRSGILIYVN